MREVGGARDGDHGLGLGSSSGPAPAVCLGSVLFPGTNFLICKTKGLNDYLEDPLCFPQAMTIQL